MKYIFTAASILFSLSSIAQVKISNVEAYKKIDHKNVQLIDVRTPEEYSKNHLKNSVNINWSNKTNFIAEASKLDKKKPIYVYCLSGGRSNKAAQYLAEQGYNVYEIEGGILKWQTAKLPLIDLDNKISGLNYNDYKTLVKSHPIVLVDFYAEWCSPCKEMAPSIEQLATKYKDQIKVVKINTDENKDLVKELGISGIPKLYIYKEGKQKWTKTGLTNLKTIEKALNL